MSLPTDKKLLDWLQGQREVMLSAIGATIRLSWLCGKRDMGVRAHTVRQAIAAAMEKERKDGT